MMGNTVFSTHAVLITGLPCGYIIAIIVFWLALIWAKFLLLLYLWICTIKAFRVRFTFALRIPSVVVWSGTRTRTETRICCFHSTFNAYHSWSPPLRAPGEVRTLESGLQSQGFTNWTTGACHAPGWDRTTSSVDLQSTALPFELQGHAWLIRRCRGYRSSEEWDMSLCPAWSSYRHVGCIPQ